MENIGKMSAWCLGQAGGTISLVVFVDFYYYFNILQLQKEGCVVKLLPSFHLGLQEFDAVHLESQ